MFLKMMYNAEIKGRARCSFWRVFLLMLQVSPTFLGSALTGDTYNFPWHKKKLLGGVSCQASLFLNPAADLFCLCFFSLLSQSFPCTFIEKQLQQCALSNFNMSLFFLELLQALVLHTSENKKGCFFSQSAYFNYIRKEIFSFFLWLQKRKGKTYEVEDTLEIRVNTKDFSTQTCLYS